MLRDVWIIFVAFGYHLPRFFGRDRQARTNNCLNGSSAQVSFQVRCRRIARRSGCVSTARTSSFLKSRPRRAPSLFSSCNLTCVPTPGLRQSRSLAFDCWQQSSDRGWNTALYRSKFLHSHTLGCYSACVKPRRKRETSSISAQCLFSNFLSA